MDEKGNGGTLGTSIEEKKEVSTHPQANASSFGALMAHRIEVWACRVRSFRFRHLEMMVCSLEFWMKGVCCFVAEVWFFCCLRLLGMVVRGFRMWLFKGSGSEFGV